MTEQFTLTLGGRDEVTARAYPAVEERRAGATLVLAHGAGAGHDHPFMVRFASGLASRGVDVLTFNFLYIEQRRRIPDRTAALESCYRAAIAAARSHAPFRGGTIVIGGKSMGGRMATHLAAEAGEDAAAAGINGVVLLGYPLHPPGKPDQLRAAHLSSIRVPMLFVQGSRDPFGTPAELQPILDGLACFDEAASSGVRRRRAAEVTLHVVENGDHSLAPPKRGAVSVEQAYDDVQELIARWVREVVTRRPM